MMSLFHFTDKKTKTQSSSVSPRPYLETDLTRLSNISKLLFGQDNEKIKPYDP